MSFQPNKGKRALVTGASSGIGAAYAKRLANDGYDLVLVARRQGRLEELSSRLKEEYDVEVENIVADLVDSEDLKRVEERIINGSPLNMLINNAGVGIYKMFAETDSTDIDQMVLLNVLALTRLTRAVLPTMLSRQSGTIINVAGGLAFIPTATRAVYSATKAYVVHFTRIIHEEVKDNGIVLQVICPGLTESEFHQKSGTDVSKLPPNILMPAEDLVNASLAGLELGEVVCIPGLSDISALNQWEEVSTELRNKMAFSNKPAARYRVNQ